MSAPAALPAPGILRRLACGIYEALLLAAVILIATFPFLAFLGDATYGWRRHMLQLWVIAVAGAYLVAFWTRGGQTVAMKTWRIRVAHNDGSGLSTRQASARFLLALCGLLLFGAGFWWGFVDRERQFLHDRLTGSRLYSTK